MRAAYYNQHGEPEKLQIGDRPKPQPARGEVLIKNVAAAIGAWDLGVMKSGYGNPPLPHIPSCEVAGIVELASDGSDFKPGDEVYGGLGFRSGGLAEYAAVATDHLAPKPENLSFAEAAALVVPAGTAYEGLIDRAQLQSGEIVLITAASGNVGTAGVQIAAATGAAVFGVASTQNHAHLRALGVTDVFDYHDPEWISQLKETVPDGVDLLFDGTGNETRDRAVDTVRDGGRGVFIVGPPNDLRSDIQAHVFSADVTQDRLAAINRLVGKGKLKPQIKAEFPLEEARNAMAQVANRHTRGRIVLKLL
jgi:NADPH2:quinone reductase